MERDDHVTLQGMLRDYIARLKESVCFQEERRTGVRALEDLFEEETDDAASRQEMLRDQIARLKNSVHFQQERAEKAEAASA